MNSWPWTLLNFTFQEDWEHHNFTLLLGRLLQLPKSVSVRGCVISWVNPAMLVTAIPKVICWGLMTNRTWVHLIHLSDYW